MRKKKTKGPADLKSQDTGARKSAKLRASFSPLSHFQQGNDFLISQQVGCSSTCRLCCQFAEAERYNHYSFQQPWLSGGWRRYTDTTSSNPTQTVFSLLANTGFCYLHFLFLPMPLPAPPTILVTVLWTIFPWLLLEQRLRGQHIWAPIDRSRRAPVSPKKEALAVTLL